jgi:hypothetical protein
MTDTNKRYSYLIAAVIQIDVHPAGENPTNTPHVFHAQSVYGPRSYVSHAVHAYQPFVKSLTELDSDKPSGRFISFIVMSH